MKRDRTWATENKNYWLEITEANPGCVTVRWYKFFLKISPSYIIQIAKNKAYLNGKVINAACNEKLELLGIKKKEEWQSTLELKAWELVKSPAVQEQIAAFNKKKEDLRAETAMEKTKILLKTEHAPNEKVNPEVIEMIRRAVNELKKRRQAAPKYGEISAEQQAWREARKKELLKGLEAKKWTKEGP